MSNKDKPNTTNQPKSNKKAQKAAKQQQKFKQAQQKPDKKQFNQLTGITIRAKEQFASQNYLLIKNKKVQQYAEQGMAHWQKGKVEIVGFGKSISKAISVAEAIKHKLGVYDEKETKVPQKTSIYKDKQSQPIIEIVLSKI